MRALLIAVFAVTALALLPAGASALLPLPIPNFGPTNSDPVAVPYNPTSDDGTFKNFACTLSRGDDPPAVVACSSTSADLGSLAEGDYHLQVIASFVYTPYCVAYDPVLTDQCIAYSTNSDVAAGALDFTVDRTAPTVSITGGPAEGSSSTDTSAAFGFSASDGTVSCKLDHAPVACDSIAALTGLAAGAHQLSVTATDAAGNDGTDTRNFTVLASGGGSTAPTGGDASGGAATEVKPSITSAPKSVKLGAKIKLHVHCPDGCKIAVVFKGAAKRLTGSIVVKPGATTVSYAISKSVIKVLRKSLKSRKKVTAIFTPAGGVAKSVTIKR